MEIIGKRKRLAKDEVVVSFYLVFTMHKNLKPRRYEASPAFLFRWALQITDDADC